MSRLAILWQSDAPGPVVTFKETEVVAKALGLQIQSLEIQGRKPDLDEAFLVATKGRADALIVLQSVLTNTHRKQIVNLAARDLLPAMYTQREYVEVGGLMSYAPSYTEIYRHAAIYVDKILKGSNPADLPVEQPTKFEFAINLKTAKEIGLTIPQSVLYRADRVIR